VKSHGLGGWEYVVYAIYEIEIGNWERKQEEEVKDSKRSDESILEVELAIQ